MSIPTVSYEDFSTSNQATVDDGGPWIVQSDVSTNAENATGCASETKSWCGGFCLTCHVQPLNPPPAYYGSFITNISVNLADYGGATSLDFTWDYWPAYCGGATTQGAGIPITSQVGDATFEEQFPALSYDAFFHSTTGGHQWDIASKISHNGSTSLVHGSDPNRGYIAIKMNVTMGFSAANHEEHLYFYVKGIKFLITTPVQSATASSSSPAGIVTGAVVGAVALVALFTLAVCLFRRRHKKGKNPIDYTIVSTEQVNHEAPTPMAEGPFPPSHLVTSYSTQPTSPASLHPPSVFSYGSYDLPQPTSSASLQPPSVLAHGSYDPPKPTTSAQPTTSGSLHPPSVFARGSYGHGPPPAYRLDDLIGHDTPPSTQSSPELARFAAANREAIDENLEARLRAAGYLPTENPSKLTPEEWKDEYGITKLELKRLQSLYERTQQVQPQ